MTSRTFALSPVAAVAFCSGVASLAYQINWQRSLSLIFGVSHFATTTVVLGFFLGFALGAEVARRFADRVHPFLLMAVLEGTVALYALISPLIFAGIKGVSTALAPPGLAGTGALLATRLTLATLAVAIPTICMGSTVPVFLKACARLPGGTGAHAALLSGINTAGAVTGSLVTTFVLMGQVASSTQVHLAAVLNAAACAIALWQWRRTPMDSKEDVSESAPPKVESRAGRPVLIAYALSGAAGLGLELVWNRIVFMSLDHTIFTFALTLTVYLAAYALGSFASGLLAKRFPASRSLIGALMLASLVCAVIGIRAYSAGLHVGSLRPPLGYFPAATGVVIAFLFLPVFFMGLTMPLVLELAARDARSVGADVASAQLMNNLGSVAAIIVVGFVLVPLTNTRATVLVCLLLLGVGVLLVVWRDASRLRRVAFSVAVFAALAFVPVAIHQGHVDHAYSKLITLREDSSGLWGIDEPQDDARVLRLNGYYENHLPLPPKGSIQGDFLIPAMVKPEVSGVFMVGMGLGVGAYELLKLPEVKRFDTAELSAAAVELAKSSWAPFGPSFFDDQRFHVVQEDGRAALEASTTPYDVVISGTNRVFYAGSTHLYSVDYWRIVKARLSPGGVFLQWLPTYSLDSTLSLLASFRAVFPDLVVLRYTNYVYMIGFKDGTPAPLDPVIDAAYARAPVVLGETALPTSRDFLGALWSVGPGLAADVPTNRDDLPVCEYSFRGFEEEERDILGELTRRQVLVPRSAGP
ncbi:MAG: hypothetical protein QM817_09270 [Archangium sp.]